MARQRDIERPAEADERYCTWRIHALLRPLFVPASDPPRPLAESLRLRIEGWRAHTSGLPAAERMAALEGLLAEAGELDRLDWHVRSLPGAKRSRAFGSP